MMFKGTVIAQIIAVLGGIYLAKIYGEEAYGLMGVFMSIVSIFSIFSSLQLEHCIITSKNKQESNFWFSFLVYLIPSISLFLALVYFLATLLIRFENLSFSFLALCFFGVITMAYNISHESLYTFNKEFKTLSYTKVFLSIGNVTFQFSLYFYFDVLGLLIGFVLSQFLVFIYNIFKNRLAFTRFELTKITTEIAKNKTIIKYLFPSNLLNSLANNFMPILILVFFSIKDAGVYFFSLKILGAPLFLISSSIAKVYFQKSSELKEKSKSGLHLLTKKLVKYNVMLMIFILILTNTLGVYLLELFFQDSWNNLRNYLLALSFLVLARSSFNPISSLIVVLDKNHIGLLFNIYLIIVNIIAIFIGNYYNSLILAVIILSVFGGLGYFTLLYYFMKLLKD